MRKLLKVSLLPALTMFLLSACMHTASGPNSNEGWDHMMGYGFMGGGMWLLWIVIAIVVVYFLIGPGRKNSPYTGGQEAPLDILKKRYAKGEIDKDEFEKLKKDIEE